MIKMHVCVCGGGGLYKTATHALISNVNPHWKRYGLIQTYQPGSLGFDSIWARMFCFVTKCPHPPFQREELSITCKNRLVLVPG